MVINTLWGYYLVDKIYSEWAIIVKTNSHPVNVKDQTFATAHESTRKDVERTFDVLRSKFWIIQNSCRMWSLKDMNTIICGCIILHNMILEDEKHINIQEFGNPDDPIISTNHDVLKIEPITKRYEEIMDRGTCRNQQHDFVEHHYIGT
jgi:hypothetical protein